ncbi:acyl-CoA dehydrogenase family protein [Parasphingorhabdus halotolerans]|uniref:Acyl-CoA/acyl-ACP dehydrogenase n=1 Tax=Parasphingorhabdus halotolerans TaxID=2725558 RepID=A0A6H2DQJ1_9SPHN|nr:acyl-CoA dehydrogenase family protein [Parasphingorhabdus halotolerans]QJB69936.1 acyl-CoA/acyl-ACP dehydrogenase [Parasphingorhabdus halotolerans]
MDNLGTLGTTEEQIELMDVATNFCRDKSPIEKVRGLIGDELGYDPDIWKEIGKLGWLAIAIPEAYDGVGLSMAEVVPIAEQMGRRLMNTPFGSTTLAAQVLLAGGSAGQQAAWLPKIAAGAAATMALQEDNGDWDLANIAASGVISGDTVTLSGKKQFVLWADSAELIIASIKIDGELRFALIERNVIVDSALRRESVIDETVRSFELTLDGLTISTDALFDASRTRETLERIELAASLIHSAEMTGGTQAVIDYTIEYLTTRKQFDKIIGSFQAVKHPTVDNYVDYEKARTHLYSAAHCWGDQGRGEVAVHMAASSAHSVYSHAADRSIQFHGAFGFTHDCDAQLYRRQAIFKGALIGDAAWHRAKLADLLFD